MSHTIIISNSIRFISKISSELIVQNYPNTSVVSPDELMAVMREVDPGLFIVDKDNISQDELIEYYTLAKWYDIQLLLTDEKKKLSI